MSKDLDELTSLNRDYVASVQNCDVKRFDQILAPEFYCSNPDGSLVDRAGFLEQIAKKSLVTNIAESDVRIVLRGDFAFIHALTTYTKPNGEQGRGRYTDVWWKRNHRWLCVSAHVTRA